MDWLPVLGGADGANVRPLVSRDVAIVVLPDDGERCENICQRRLAVGAQQKDANLRDCRGRIFRKEVSRIREFRPLFDFDLGHRHCKGDRRRLICRALLICLRSLTDADRISLRERALSIIALPTKADERFRVGCQLAGRECELDIPPDHLPTAFGGERDDGIRHGRRRGYVFVATHRC